MTFNYIIIVCGFILLLAIYFPARHARYYECIDTENVIDHLYFPAKPKINPKLRNCSYDIYPNKVLEISEHRTYEKPNIGGEYFPTGCNSLFRSAIIIPYRDRKQQLDYFLNYMHHFLQSQNVSYKIFVVEQDDGDRFNRARLLNYGAKVAIDERYPCLILHDVDLIPLNYGNIYACTRNPRHMSSSIDIFRYNLPYIDLFGGAVAIRSRQFQSINGMSNKFNGWGGEDDDLFRRIKTLNLEVTRFCPVTSKYVMLSHKKNRQASNDRFDLLRDTEKLYRVDGLNSLKKNFNVTLFDLYTKISVF